MDYEDDELDRVDFFKISKRAGHGLKKRKGLVGCQLDDRLSSRQKDAIEEVTALFPQMSPKSVMAETLRVLETAGEAERRTQTMKGDLRRQIKLGVNVAKIAVQRLVSEISKGTGPTNEVRANNLALEREVIKLRREVDTLRREREMMREQINALQYEAESLPPAYRPPIGGVRRRLEDRPPRPTRVNEMGDIVMGDTGRSTLYKRGDAYAERTRNGPMGNNDGAGLGDDRDLESSPPPMDYPASAVLIKCAENKDRPGGVTYAEVMKLARSKISLDDLSITNTRIRKAQAGGLLIEIPGGEETGAKAEALVDKLKGVIAENEYKEEVNVVRPMRRAEMRLVDIDQSVTAEEVAEAVARNGVSEELRLGIVAIAEPNSVPDNGRWVASGDNPPSAAITWQWSRERVPCSETIRRIPIIFERVRNLMLRHAVAYIDARDEYFEHFL
ncbi:hypothetical protein ALC57_18335 [Trachymyrmex cornetzi]|uniref:Uncharacterized protein n=1 Tax=Trachymyrmex cornetzi TaxID=471704 RepID=A0A151IS33_9HYME|nr:hypothetical protein ALC57_18335 [Trachymyrmex cornetzi]